MDASPHAEAAECASVRLRVTEEPLPVAKKRAWRKVKAKKPGEQLESDAQDSAWQSSDLPSTIQAPAPARVMPAQVLADEPAVAEVKPGQNSLQAVKEVKPEQTSLEAVKEVQPEPTSLAVKEVKPEQSSVEAVKEERKKPEEKVKEKAASLRHGKFTTDGRVQEFVYIPSGDADLASKSADIFETILRDWNLQRPHLLIKFQSGFAHPKYLLEQKELDKLENDSTRSELRRYYEHFLRQQEQADREKEAKDKAKEAKEEEEDDEEEALSEKDRAKLEEKRRKEELVKEAKRKSEQKAKALEQLNDFLYRSLSNLIDVIVRAAVRNHCWILVEGGPTGGLLLLKQAVERCKERPVVLVMDSFRKKRYPYAEVEGFLEKEKPNSLKHLLKKDPQGLQQTLEAAGLELANLLKDDHQALDPGPRAPGLWERPF
ncbi:unnamed protein product [Effrenium voratum]|uniref:Uncharacterized protein n=1 Tax=Effrenium voratum TaxID=2562239 RepID=A0AA36NCX5_9DINO|nr:unnamed protein product [Effrenium voratum]